MPAMLLFSAKPYVLESRAIAKAIHDSFALTAYPWVEGAKGAAFPKPDEEGQSGFLFVELPELEEGEGVPLVEIEVTPRLDREESFQEMIDEIVAQEKALDKGLNKNHADLVLTFEDTAAAFEAACMAAYAIAEATESGVLVPAFEEGEETLWFDTAEDFADEIFSEDEDEDGEEGNEEGEDDER